MSDEYNNNWDEADNHSENINNTESSTRENSSENSSYSYENYYSGSSSQTNGTSGSGDRYSSYDYRSSSSDDKTDTNERSNRTYDYGSPNHTYYSDDRFDEGSGRGPSGGNGGKRNKKGAAVLAVALAAVFVVCAGAGIWGVRTYLGQSTASVSSSATAGDASNNGEITESDDNSNEVTSDGQNTENTSDVKTAQSTEDADEETVDATVATSSGLVLSEAEAPETEISKIVEEVMPSVVSVYNSYTQETQYFGQTYSTEAESTGSGIIVGKTDEELLIVTNNHVVEDADSLSVQFIDETNASADIKGTDSSADLAVIAVQLADISEDTLNSISVATLNASGNTKVGEDVIAIGNALGYGQSVTTGIVSAVDREITQEDGITGTFIQTDAAINPGNSGGALLNMNGEVIGINSSKIGGSSVEGMGFAIPISKALPIIEELMSQETKTKVEEDEQGTLGISGVSVTSDVASAYDMPEGVYVAQILDGGGASTSDLQKGDIITAIGGVSISSMESLQKQLQYYAAGTTVSLTVQRQDGSGAYEEVTVDVTLGTQESLQQASQSGESEQNGTGNQQDQSSQEQDDNQRSGSGYGSMFPFGF